MTNLIQVLAHPGNRRTFLKLLFFSILAIVLPVWFVTWSLSKASNYWLGNDISMKTLYGGFGSIVILNVVIMCYIASAIAEEEPERESGSGGGGNTANDPAEPARGAIEDDASLETRGASGAAEDARASVETRGASGAVEDGGAVETTEASDKKPADSDTTAKPQEHSLDDSRSDEPSSSKPSAGGVRRR